MAVIEVTEETAQALCACAKARNVSLVSFLREIANASAPVTVASPIAAQDLDCLSECAAGEYPPLPRGFSRADIYEEQFPDKEQES